MQACISPTPQNENFDTQSHVCLFFVVHHQLTRRKAYRDWGEGMKSAVNPWILFIHSNFELSLGILLPNPKFSRVKRTQRTSRMGEIHIFYIAGGGFSFRWKGFQIRAKEQKLKIVFKKLGAGHQGPPRAYCKWMHFSGCHLGCLHTHRVAVRRAKQTGRLTLTGFSVHSMGCS